MVDIQIQYPNQSLKMKTALMLAVCFMGVICQFNPTRNITIPSNTIEIEYSPNQEYFGAGSTSQLFIFKSQSGQKITQLNYNASNILVNFAFSHAGDYLAVGFSSGEVRVYQFVDNAFVDINSTYKYPGSSSVDQLCFTADDSAIVIGIHQNDIVYWPKNGSKVYSTTFDGNFVNTVSCSPTDKDLFVVGGYVGQATNRFVFYTFNGTDITVVKQINASIASKIEGSDISADGIFAYRVGFDGVVYRYNISADFQQSSLVINQLQNKNLTKVRVSSNGRIISTVYQGVVAILKQVDSVQSQVKQYSFSQLSAISVELYPTTSRTVALSSKGGHVIFAAQDGQAAVYDQCKRGFYADELGNCLACAANCQQCDNPTTCYVCDERYYLNGGLCAKCSDGCLQCVDDTECTKCDTVNHFVPTPDNKCKCDVAFFFRDFLCFACSHGCIQCDNQTECINCKPEFELIDKVCICPAGTYPIDETCLACERGCAQCQDAITCQKCKDAEHYILYNGSCICDSSKHYIDDDTKTNCVCQAGFYDLTSQCLACPLGCLTCTSASACQSCNTGLQTKGGLCECVQDASFIGTDGFCHLCKETLNFCANCTSATTCTICVPGLNREPKNGVCVCIAKYFEDVDLLCKECTLDGCRECKTAEQCNVCDETAWWELDPFTHKCRCMKGHTQVNGTCVQCPVGCRTCDANRDCIECDTQNHWKKEGSICTCMNAYYEDAEECLPCMAGCLNCAELNICLECNTLAEFHLVDGVCVCNKGFYISDMSCKTCGIMPNCINCNNQSHCLQCAQPFHVNASSLCGCQPGQYAHNTECVTCPQGCKLCDHEDICTQCNDKYDLEDNVCKKSGIDTLVIVLIVVGVIVLAGAIFVIIKCIKKRRTPLSQDDYEEL